MTEEILSKETEPSALLYLNWEQETVPDPHIPQELWEILRLAMREAIEVKQAQWGKKEDLVADRADRGGTCIFNDTVVKRMMEKGYMVQSASGADIGMQPEKRPLSDAPAYEQGHQIPVVHLPEMNGVLITDISAAQFTPYNPDLLHEAVVVIAPNDPSVIARTCEQMYGGQWKVENFPEDYLTNILGVPVPK